MALDENRWGPAVAARLRTVSIPQDRFITNDELDTVWKAITDEHKKEVRGHADIDLENADIPVNPGTFQTVNTSDPITGQALSAAVTLETRIK